jgi:hypothetical protein
MSRKCPRTWEVEAARDDRLAGNAAEQLATHLHSCASCAREAAALRELGNRLRFSPAPSVDEVSLKRLQRAVLRKAALELSRAAPSAAARATLWAAAAGACALAVAGWLVVRFARAPASNHPLVEVTEVPGARWAEHAEPGADRIELASGTLNVHVVRHDGERAFVVGLPDGEIVDIGTRFSVTVEGQRTRHVHVDEGRIFLRLHDGVSIELEPGRSWDAAPAETSAGEAPAVFTPAPLAVAPVSMAPGLAMPAAKPRIRRQASLDGGAADAEDAAYLRVLKLWRAGRAAEARAAARDYLRDFPSGFRTPELRRLADAPAGTDQDPRLP